MMRQLLSACLMLVLSACASSANVGSLFSEADLSTLSLTNPQNAQGRVLTGGQPSPEDLAALKDLGFGTIISLRTEGEDIGYDEQAMAEELRLTFVNIPVGIKNGLTAATASNLRSAVNQTKAPVFLHCGSGNRVGAVYALGAYYLDGKSIEEALEVGRATGLTGFEPTVRKLLERGEGR